MSSTHTTNEQAERDSKTSAASGDEDIGPASMLESASFGLLGQLRDPVLVCDTKERVLYVNAAMLALTGYAPHDLLDQELSMLQPLSGQFTNTPTIRLSQLEPHDPWVNEIALRIKSGEVKTVLYSVSPLRETAAGPVTGYVLMLRDGYACRRCGLDYRLFKALVGNTPDPVLIHDMGGRLLYANQASVELLGDDIAERLQDHSFESLIVPKDRKAYTSRIAQALQDDEWCGDLRVVNRNGEAHAVSLSRGVLRDGDGQAWGSFMVLRDQLDRRRLQQQALESERRYRTIVHSVPTCIIVLNREGVIEEINRSPPLGNDTQPEDWRGRPITDLFLLPPDRMSDLVRRLMEGESIRMDVVHGQDPSGDSVTCALRGMPLVGEDGPEGALLVIDDITERLASEERDTLLASITQCSNDAIVSIDVGGIIQSWNAAAEALFHCGYGEMVGESWTQLVPVHRRDEWRRILRLADADAASRQVETGVVTRSGDEEPVEVTVSALRDRGGERVGSALLLRSVAERKRMEQRLRQAERLAAVGQLAAGIAHEINNPLTSIKGSFYIVRKALPPGDRSTEFADIIESEINRITGIVNGLLDCYRPRVKNWARFEIPMVIRDILKLVQTELDAKEIKTTLVLDESVPPLLSSEESIKQVLLNLMLNAVQSMENGGLLSITTSMDDEMIRIAVSDTGCGISAEDQPHVFDPFFTTKQKSSQTTGMGLGLSISMGIVETLGGFIEVDSKLDEGSTFTVLLPIDATTGHRESHEHS